MAQLKPAKITIVGAGYIGSTTAFALVQSGLVSDLVLIDVNRTRAEGEAIDLSHAASFGPPIRVSVGEAPDTHGSNIVIFAAGVNQKPGESRLDLLHRNISVVREALPPIVSHAKDAIILMVTNPVDVLTFVAWKISGLPVERVLGSGTVLDSARFRQLLGAHFLVDPRNVHAYVVGEHGDTEVPVWSRANLAGISLEDYTNEAESFKLETSNQVREAAYRIIERKGATAYGPAMALKRICEAIIRDENSVLTVSTVVQGLYGIGEVCLSLPCIINRDGRRHILPVRLDSSEEEDLRRSATTLRRVLDSLNL